MKDTTVGYTGGTTKDPTYTQVCTGLTGHAEAVEVDFDPKVVSYEALVRAFFNLHDPAHGGHGGQYRSAIFTHSPKQSETARTVKAALSESLGKEIKTEIREAPRFYKAEEYHQDYLSKRGMAPTCRR